MNPQNPFRSCFNSRLPRAWRRRLRNEHGGTLVETAFTITLLFVFIFGIMELSLALYSYHFVSDAAREATRYAMVRGSDWSSSCDGTGKAGSGSTSAGCIASATDIQNYVQNMGFPGIVGSNMTVTTTCATTIGGTFTAYPGTTACNGNGNVVQVTVSYPFTFGVPGMKKFNYSLASTSQMVISQ